MTAGAKTKVMTLIGKRLDNKGVKMKIYRVVLYRNGKELIGAGGPDLNQLLNWANDCQKEDKTIIYKVWEA